VSIADTENFFAENDILNFKGDQKRKRILWINEDYSFAYVIDVDLLKLNIDVYLMSELHEDFESHDLEIIMKDPTYKVRLEENISEASKALRDKMFEVIDYIAKQANEPDIFDDKERRKKILEAINKFNVSEPTIYKYLRIYWQSGKLKDSLVPYYNKCGGKGKDKKLSDKKTGRPPGKPKSKKDTLFIFEKDDDDDSGNGVNITEDIKDIFKLVLKKYHKDGVYLSVVYRRMKVDYFQVDSIDKDGENVKKMLPYGKMPNYRQFVRWSHKIESEEKKSIAKIGIYKHKMKYLLTEGNMTNKSLGPGFRYEIDATYSQVYLLNSIDGSLSIGEAVYYVVIDEFSRYVNGVEVTLNNPSGEGAMKCIYNCSENKVDYCKRYGLTITEDEWPYPGVPTKLLADNGELAGLIPEKAIVNLRIEMLSARSYTPQDKPIVERLFRKIKDSLRPFVPGMVMKGGKRVGEKDRRLDAVLNMTEFTKIILRAIIWHNNTPMDSYPLSQDLIRDRVPKIPVEIYKWGIKHFQGAPRHYNDDFLKLNLMTVGKASVTPEGIKFKTLYDCNIARVEEWYYLAKRYANWKVDIRYNRGDLSVIYIINPNSNEYEACTMKNVKDYCMGKTFEEISQYQVKEKIRDKTASNIKNQKTAEFYEGIQEDVKQAKKGKVNIGEPITIKRKILSNINQNRKQEVEDLKKEKSFKLGINNDGEKSTINKTIIENTNANIIRKPNKVYDTWMKGVVERKKNE